MRAVIISWVLLTLTHPGVARAFEPPSIFPDLTYIEQGRAPWCSAAASLMAMSRFKKPPPLVKFVRELTVNRDGIAWMDINDRLKDLGIKAQVVTTTVLELKGWLNAGLPVVLALKDGMGRHAVTAHAASKNGIHILDPQAPGHRFMSDDTLRRKWSARQAVVIWAGPAPAALNVTHVEAQDRTYRARELGLRAARVISRPKDAARFYEKAIALDNSIPELHFNLGLVMSAIGLRDRACRSHLKALRLKPDWHRPKQEIKRWQCP